MWTEILDLISERPEPEVRGYFEAHSLFLPSIYSLEAVSSCWNNERTTRDAKYSLLNKALD